MAIVEGIFVNTELFTGDLASYLDKDVWTWDDFHEIADEVHQLHQMQME